MMKADRYEALARMLDYPNDKSTLQTDCEAVATSMDNSEAKATLDSFGCFTDASSLAELQEDYVATFDFNPATAPYLGHHLYGDNQKKGAYMIALKQQFAHFGYSPAGHELPDHLSVLLGFLAHLSRHEKDADRQLIIADYMLPGVKRMTTAFADRQESPWKALIETAEFLCAEECKEAQSC